MKQFVKNPIVIEAEQWWGTTAQAVELKTAGVIKSIDPETGSCVISTLEGDMTCNLNDYIIKGVKGEYYPCKEDIFEITYSPVE